MIRIDQGKKVGVALTVGKIYELVSISKHKVFYTINGVTGILSENVPYVFKASSNSMVLECVEGNAIANLTESYENGSNDFVPLPAQPEPDPKPPEGTVPKYGMWAKRFVSPNYYFTINDANWFKYSGYHRFEINYAAGLSAAGDNSEHNDWSLTALPNQAIDRYIYLTAPRAVSGPFYISHTIPVDINSNGKGLYTWNATPNAMRGTISTVWLAPLD